MTYIANADTFFGKEGINWPYGWTIIHWSPGWKYIDLKKLKLLRTVGIVLPIVGAEDKSKWVCSIRCSKSI
jgi:hypothetical protein